MCAQVHNIFHQQEMCGQDLAVVGVARDELTSAARTWPLGLPTQPSLQLRLGGTDAPDLRIGKDPGSDNTLRMRSTALRMRRKLSDPGSFPIRMSGASVLPSAVAADLVRTADRCDGGADGRCWY